MAGPSDEKKETEPPVFASQRFRFEMENIFIFLRLKAHFLIKICILYVTGGRQKNRGLSQERKNERIKKKDGCCGAFIRKPCPCGLQKFRAKKDFAKSRELERANFF